MADAAVLDQVFRALSDATRRDVVERLTVGPASVSELAEPYGMSLPGFMKHLAVLEEAGLVVRAKEGRTVRCELAPAALEDAAMWLAHYEKFWSARLDALGPLPVPPGGSAGMDSPVGERPQLRLTRRYPVAAEKVWRAWTDPQALSAWFGPGEPHSVTEAELDVRPGGRYRIRFHTPDGEEHEVCGAYEVVEPQRRLVFSWAWRSTPERVSRVTLRLQPVPGGTELDFLHERFFDEAARAGHERGWTATFAKLDRWLTSGSDRADSGRRG